jgi:hypothetical protein
MPNWVDITLVVKGDNHLREKFHSGIKEVDGELRIFDSYVPCPQELTNGMAPARDQILAKNNIEKYGAPDWYSWMNRYVGTKWGDCHTVLIKVSRVAHTYHFDTAWSLPHEGMITMTKMFPGLRFALRDVVEEGGFFMGSIVYWNGEVVQNNIHVPARSL